MASSSPGSSDQVSGEERSKSTREWILFGISVVGLAVGLVVWFYGQLSALETRIEDSCVSVAVYDGQQKSLQEKLDEVKSSKSSKDELRLLDQRLRSFKREFETFATQEHSSWDAVWKSSKDIRDLVDGIRLQLARILR